jgi:CubicO group peptidase (beta-lactamase class C family)
MLAAVVRMTPAIPRVPGVPDVQRRCRVPADVSAVTTIGEEASPADAGMAAADVERVWRGVEKVYRSGVHPAVALCVRRGGQVVLDRAIGHASGNGPWDGASVPKVTATPETPFLLYSGSKAITGVVAHMLDERGLIHIGDRVCEYIPEYARNGKRGITIEHVLSHRAGVPNLPPEALDLDLLSDPAAGVELMCEQRPSTRPGTLLAYHAVSGGFIIGEIVRRVTGMDIRSYLRSEVLDPLGFRWMSYGVSESDLPAVATNYATGFPVVPPLSWGLTRALGRSVDEVTRISNDPRFLTGIIPAANTVSTANELSRFYEMLRCGGVLDGVRVMEARTIRRAVTEQSYMEIDLTLGFPTRYGLGFMLGADRLSLYGADTKAAFGHLGFTNILGWTDPARELSVGFLTSGKPVLYPELIHMLKAAARITKAAPKVPLGTTELWT